MEIDVVIRGHVRFWRVKNGLAALETEEKHNITTARLTKLFRSYCQSVYLQEMNVILSERQLLEFILRLPHLRNLPLETIHESLGSAHRSFLLNSDQLVHSTTPFVRHQDDFSVGLFILVDRCVPRTLRVERNGA